MVILGLTDSGNDTAQLLRAGVVQSRHAPLRCALGLLNPLLPEGAKRGFCKGEVQCRPSLVTPPIGFPPVVITQRTC